MNNLLSKINPRKETEKIINFLKKTFKEQKINRVVIGLSGGIDSTVCYYLLKKVLPERNIFPVHLPYYNTPGVFQNVPTIQIKTIVDKISTVNRLRSTDKIRLGNIMSRTRMIVLFDLAKKHNALVCGTENKSEHLLGYFTRFGDSASDIEPIRHLYKTQVYQLAEFLKVPKKIINQKPSANLWKNQTDEGQFGFTYQEADQVLYLYFDEKKSTDKIFKMGYPNAVKIINYAKKNAFKQKTPYSLNK
jgi:NAD+ synthase